MWDSEIKIGRDVCKKARLYSQGYRADLNSSLIGSSICNLSSGLNVIIR